MGWISGICAWQGATAYKDVPKMPKNLKRARQTFYTPSYLKELNGIQGLFQTHFRSKTINFSLTVTVPVKRVLTNSMGLGSLTLPKKQLMPCVSLKMKYWQCWFWLQACWQSSSLSLGMATVIWFFQISSRLWILSYSINVLRKKIPLMMHLLIVKNLTYSNSTCCIWILGSNSMTNVCGTKNRPAMSWDENPSLLMRKFSSVQFLTLNCRLPLSLVL